MGERFVIHLNITDFAVAVERLCDTSLRHVPLIVGPEQAPRGRVFDMSEEAYRDGVRKGMSLGAARRYCHRARIVTPRPSLYRKAMTAVVRQAFSYTPLVEQGVDDGHLFMDVSGTHRLFGPPPDVAWQLRKRMVKDLGLDPVWTLASSKLLAKVSSRVVRPHGEYIVGEGEERSFLAPLAISLLPGLTMSEMRTLASFNLSKIGELASLSREDLRVPFRQRGDLLYDMSRGLDKSLVVPGVSGAVTVEMEHVFSEATMYYREVKCVLTGMVHGIGRKLRLRKILARRLKLTVEYSDGQTASCSVDWAKGTDNDFVLRSLAVSALDKVWRRRIRLRGCAIACVRFVPCSPQKSLFVLESAKELQRKKILAAMDMVHSRFGPALLRLGTCA